MPSGGQIGTFKQERLQMNTLGAKIVLWAYESLTSKGIRANDSLVLDQIRDGFKNIKQLDEIEALLKKNEAEFGTVNIQEKED
jgi:hypothetical protein